MLQSRAQRAIASRLRRETRRRALDSPRVITVDKNAAYPKAIEELKVKKELPEILELRQKKYFNNIVEQDHRGIKRLVKPGMGFGSFNTALAFVEGI